MSEQEGTMPTERERLANRMTRQAATLRGTCDLDMVPSMWEPRLREWAEWLDDAAAALSSSESAPVDRARDVGVDPFDEPDTEEPVDAATELAGVIGFLGLERGDHDEVSWWLPAEPGPIECASVAEAVEQLMRLTENDTRRALAGEVSK